MRALELHAILNRLDHETAAAGPEHWTIDGEPLTDEQREVIRTATDEDKQVVHDLTVLDARELGLPSPCGCDHTEQRPDG